MRKLFLILTLALVASGAFAQQTRTIIDYNGFDWTTWTMEQKVAVVTGYILGIDTYRTAMQVAFARTQDDTVKKTLSSMYDWGNISANVGQICLRIDQLYNQRTNDGSYGNRGYPIFELIVHDFQVPWWIDKNGNDLNPDGTRKDGVVPAPGS